MENRNAFLTPFCARSKKIFVQVMTAKYSHHQRHILRGRAIFPKSAWPLFGVSKFYTYIKGQNPPGKKASKGGVKNGLKQA